MNILLIAQCDKKALTESRRIIDQFAERRGDCVWQTAITKQGLDTLRRMLKKTARKNTAVACHWIHGKNRSELLWIVGSASCFGVRGAVPTNTTLRKVLRIEDEHAWRGAEKVRLLAAMAALWHDVGKANRAFQNKLQKKRAIADALRHEWVSLRMLQAFVGDDNDDEWLGRLATLPEQPDLSWMQRLVRDVGEAELGSPFRTLKQAPLATIIGWLIVAHHRIPVQVGGFDERPPEPSERLLRRLPKGIDAQWCGARLSSEDLESAQACWTFDHSVPFTSRAWRTRVRKHARRIIENKSLFDEAFCADLDPYALHLTRLVLMLADHHYSGLSDDKRRAPRDTGYPLIANTLRPTGEPNQRLDEHLIGVEIDTGRIVHQLPSLVHHLPRIAHHRGFSRRSRAKRFAWQDRAYDLAMSVRQRSALRGFLGVNMASTGKGKTLANGRIMYALADPHLGARFTIALGLRVLTLQTGEVYRSRLGLGADDLAVLVGGARARELYDHGLQQRAPEDASGSESTETLIEEGSYVHYEGSVAHGPLSEWLECTRGATNLVSAPILTCTIDHLMPATESRRGGHQIAPMLRLMTADLVLDEPDDFGLEDLPALARLVHWAGMLGTRVLLSSATLPPALVQALFAAYLAGRRSFQSNHGDANESVAPVVAWFDEYTCQADELGDVESFAAQHEDWAQRRCAALAAETHRRRRAVIVELPQVDDHDNAAIAQTVVPTLVEQMHALHARHRSVDPLSKKRVSFGLLRMANIQPLVEVTRAIASLGARPAHRLHLVCYHSQHPLLVRSQTERRLDRLLSRHNPEAVFSDVELRGLLDRHHEQDQIFVVIATPVAEVGRDHDYDWAIVEPSSMRSIIQLAGRVRRHRKGSAKTPNLVLLEQNLRALKGKRPAYCRPGFEAKDFELRTHHLRELLSESQLERIDASARVLEREQPDPKGNLADLEHSHMRAVLLDDGQRRTLAASQWWTTRAHMSGELQRVQRFRDDPQGRQRFGLRLDDDDEGTVDFVRIEYDGTVTPQNNLFKFKPVALSASRSDSVGFLGGEDFRTQVEGLAQELDLDAVECARRYGIVDLPARGAEQGFYYNPVLGFWRHD